jgi:hypothetical protein
MSTLNEITTLIAEKLERELDDPFKLMLAERVDWWRSTLLSRSLEKNPEQVSLFRYPLVATMREYTDPLSIPLSCTKYISKQIPKRLRYNNGKWLYVGAVDGSHPFRFAEPGQLDYLQSGKYSGNTVFYEDINHCIVMRRFVPLIKIDDVFDSGMEILRFMKKPGEDCDIFEDEYPVTKDILQMINQYVEAEFNRLPGTETEIAVNNEEK